MTDQADEPDRLDRLADDYQDFRLRTEPTWAHLIGEYRYADQFEAVSRAAEEAASAESRSYAARAEALDESRLDDQQRITREMIAWDARSQADLLDSRTSEFGADPISGEQATLNVSIAKLGIPDTTVAEAMVGKFRGVAVYFHD